MMMFRRIRECRCSKRPRGSWLVEGLYQHGLERLAHLWSFLFLEVDCAEDSIFTHSCSRYLQVIDNLTTTSIMKLSVPLIALTSVASTSAHTIFSQLTSGGKTYGRARLIQKSIQAANNLSKRFPMPSELHHTTVYVPKPYALRPSVSALTLASPASNRCHSCSDSVQWASKPYHSFG